MFFIENNSVAEEVPDEPGIKVAPSSTRCIHLLFQKWLKIGRSKKAWESSSAASEVDSDSELEDEGEDYSTRHLIPYQLVPPPGMKSYEHAVRKEPFLASKVCGYLDIGTVVQVEADCGDWLKVRAHRRAVSRLSNDSRKEKKDKETWGWCLRHNEGHDYLIKLHDTIHENEEEDEDSDRDPNNINDFGVSEDNYEGVWYEMEDEEGMMKIFTFFSTDKIS